jgi:hypothetical protein
MGYSMPKTDELVQSLLRTNFVNDARTVFSVDTGRAAYDNLVELFGADAVIDTHAGREDAVAAYVDAFCAEPNDGD